MIRFLSLAPLFLAGVLLTKCTSVLSFQIIGPTTTFSRTVALFATHRTSVSGKQEFTDISPSQQQSRSRRALLQQDLPAAFLASTVFLATTTAPANALVKGNAPPSSMKPAGSTKPKCTNVEECQALAELKQEEEREAAEASRVPVKKTKGGVIYRDEVLPEGDSNAETAAAKDGDDVTLYYKVLKLGKRSYDGLSGEGTVVFSRGYGLEDDEKKPGDKVFETTVGAYSNIAALNEALVGMRVGGVRRVVVLPQKGWRKPTAMCDGGPGGEGKGGDLKTDYVLVPTATMVEQEACFDTSRQPFPATYPQQRRMAQRFDQSLIMEIELRSISSTAQ